MCFFFLRIAPRILLATRRRHAVRMGVASIFATVRSGTVYTGLATRARVTVLCHPLSLLGLHPRLVLHPTLVKGLGFPHRTLGIELDPRLGLVSTPWLRLVDSASRDLPKPRLVVHDLDLLIVHQLLANGVCLLAVRPLLEVDEHTLERYTVLGLPLHHVNPLNLAKMELVEHVRNPPIGDVRKHPRNAQRRLRARKVREGSHSLSF